MSKRPLPGLTGLADGLAPERAALNGLTWPRLAPTALGPPLPVSYGNSADASKATSPQKHLRARRFTGAVGRTGEPAACEDRPPPLRGRDPARWEESRTGSAAGRADGLRDVRRDVLGVLARVDAGRH